MNGVSTPRIAVLSDSGVMSRPSSGTHARPRQREGAYTWILMVLLVAATAFSVFDTYLLLSLLSG